jgi:hypothetical protein
MPWAPDYVTEDQVADYLRAGDDTEDVDLHPLAISTASRAVDDHTNRQFGKVDGPVERFYTPWPDDERGVWCVDIDDLMDTTGVVVKVNGTTVTTYTLEPRNAAADGEPWTLLVFTDASEAAPTSTDDEVSVMAPWGWSAIPARVTTATLLQTSRFVKRRDAPFGIAGSPELGGEMRLLAKLDPDVAVALRGLVRTRKVG